MDTRKRSVVKTISWRIIVIVLLTIVSYAITGNWEKTGWCVVSLLGMTVLYYLHERMWDKIQWGKEVEVERKIMNQPKPSGLVTRYINGSNTRT